MLVASLKNRQSRTACGYMHLGFKNWFTLLAVHISSYGCTWEVWRALKKLELPSATTTWAVTHVFFLVDYN